MDTIPVHLARYLRWHKAQGHSPRTLEWHQRTVGWFCDWLAVNDHAITITNLSADLVRSWVADQLDRGLSAYSVANRVRSIKAFSAWLVAEEWLDRDPLRRVAVPRVDVLTPDILTPADVQKLLACCPKTLAGLRNRAIMLLLYSTGLRAGELLAIRHDDFDATRATLLVRRSKSRRFRVLPLSPRVETAIVRYRDHPDYPATSDVLFVGRFGAPLTLTGLYLMLMRMGRRVGIHANPHKWRHSSAIAYLRNGGQLETLKELLGHSSITMTLHYARIVASDVIDQHATADPLRSVK